MGEAAIDVLGVDYSSEAIAYACEFPSRNTRFAIANLDEGSPDFHPDVVTCFQGLEHLDDPKRVIQDFSDATWIFAVPVGEDSGNPWHHHNIGVDTISDWFPGANLWYMVDNVGIFSEPQGHFQNYVGIWHG